LVNLAAGTSRLVGQIGWHRRHGGPFGDLVPRAAVRLKQHIGKPPIWAAQKFRHSWRGERPQPPQQRFSGLAAAHNGARADEGCSAGLEAG
jgi:hypothetical protein